MEYQRRLLLHPVGDTAPLPTPKSSVTPRNFSMIVLAFTLFVLAVSAFIFILVLDKRIDDSGARQRVAIEDEALDNVVILLQRAQVLETNILQQKNTSLTLQANYIALRDWVNSNMMNILLIDNLNGLGSQINTTIIDIATILDARILLLEQAFAEVLSTASHPEITSVIKSGTCDLQGLTSTSLTYEYRQVDVSGLSYYYYFFNDTTQTLIDVDDTGFVIANCNPILYIGPNNNVFAPVLAQQQEAFGGTAAANIDEVGAGSNELRFQTQSFVGTKTVGLISPLTHFVSFF